jgi:RND superfamily putative drug exporter
MELLGRANWWIPGWLDRVLPRVHIEAQSDEVEAELSELLRSESEEVVRR